MRFVRDVGSKVDRSVCGVVDSDNGGDVERVDGGKVEL